MAKTKDLLGLTAKIAYGATTGVRFVQVDIETTSEFLEPNLKEQVQMVMRELGMKVGAHGEIGEVMALESAELRLWEQAQIRLCETVRHAAELGLFYVNVHLSVKPQMIFEEARYQTQGFYYPIVGFDGKPIHVICDEVPAAKALAEDYISLHYTVDPAAIKRKQDEIAKDETKKSDEKLKQLTKSFTDDISAAVNAGHISRHEADARLRELISNAHFQVNQEAGQNVERRISNPDVVYDIWKDSAYGKYLLKIGEIGAYRIVAKYMQENHDPLWENICGGDPVAAYRDNHGNFNAAVSAKYIEGHLLCKTHKANKQHLNGMSIKEWCDKNKIYLLFETAHAAEGMEGLLRFFDPRHAYHMIKKLNSPYIKQCIDFEHMLANKLEPDKVLVDLPNDAGGQILLFHLGQTVPYFGTTHGTIQRGSHAQEHIYRWLWMMKKKGFKDGYLLYERGGGNTPLEVLQDSVQSLRLIAEELEKGTDPDNLPQKFYGISQENVAVFTRQRVAMREHFMDPISGLLALPEETHTFFGKAAAERGKAEEWKKGKYR